MKPALNTRGQIITPLRPLQQAAGSLAPSASVEHLLHRQRGAVDQGLLLGLGTRGQRQQCQHDG